MQSLLLSVASIFERPVEQLQELDRRPLPLAFVEGQYETFVVRDLATGETLEVTIDLESGRRVDPVELRNHDRQRATVEGRRLEPELLELMLPLVRADCEVCDTYEIQCPAREEADDDE